MRAAPLSAAGPAPDAHPETRPAPGRLRISFVLPFASLAGGTRVVAGHAAELIAQGHEVTVISQPDVPPAAPPLVTLARRLRLVPPARRRLPTPLLAGLGPRHILLDRARPVRDADLPEADAVVATWWETAEWVAALSPSRGRKFQLVQDYEIFPHLPADRVAASLALPLRKIAVSGYVRDMLMRHHGLSDVAVLPNPVDPALFDAPPRGRGRPFTLGFLYTTVRRKNLGLALAAVRAAQAADPGLRVLAFGTSPPVPEHPLPEGVEYHVNPPQGAIAGLYAACDLWLFTSEHEGFGLPILEAMACRTPVLATRAGAAPDLIDGRNGRLVEADPAAFAAAVAEIRGADPARWAEMSLAAWTTARAHAPGPLAARLAALLGGT
jgi:glycosyltransferase involved in cell wall biosynthesis